MKTLYASVLFCLLMVVGCESNEVTIKTGPLRFSFATRHHPGGRTAEADTPAFVSYTLTKPDGSTISNKIELYEFNGDYVTQPQQLDAGEYELQEFLILSSDNNALYATPVVGSPLADLVDHPLPFSIIINPSEITTVVPEVVAVDHYTPEDFGYAVFGFEIVETINLVTLATVADHIADASVDYEIEVTAKDGPLGNIEWTKTVNVTDTGKLVVPSEYAHFTFKAIKPGFISHLQYYFKSGLSADDTLSFEFIPESLNGFVRKDLLNGVKVYFPSDEFRCKLYARVDLPEDYALEYCMTEKFATTAGGLGLLNGYRKSKLMVYDETDMLSLKKHAVNIFGNTSFDNAENFCTPLNPGTGKTMDDIDISALIYMLTAKLIDGIPDGSLNSGGHVSRGSNNL